MTAPAARVRSVAVAETATAEGDATLVSLGLGSCVAIMVHVPARGAGGLAHVLLPDPSMARDATNPSKFASTAVPHLLERLAAEGPLDGATARLVGGAKMFAQLLPKGGVNMGERNVAAARRALEAAGIPVTAEDVGGEQGRSVFFHVGSGRVTVRTVREGSRVL